MTVFLPCNDMFIFLLDICMHYIVNNYYIVYLHFEIYSFHLIILNDMSAEYIIDSNLYSSHHTHSFLLHQHYQNLL